LFADFEPLVRDAGVELLDVEMLSENRTTILRATIFRPEGITLDDCVKTQHILSDRLDETDPIQGSYSLEVSSPGIERVLRRPKEFDIFKGKPCRVSLFSPQDGKRVFEGRLVELAVGPDGSESVVIEMDDETDRSGKPQGGKSAGGKSAGGKSAGGKSAGGKTGGKTGGMTGGMTGGKTGDKTGDKTEGKTEGMTGGKAPEAKAEQAQEDPAGGRRLVSFDRKNVSKVKLLYREEDLKKGLN